MSLVSTGAVDHNIADVRNRWAVISRGRALGREPAIVSEVCVHACLEQSDIQSAEEQERGVLGTHDLPFGELERTQTAMSAVTWQI